MVTIREIAPGPVAMSARHGSKCPYRSIEILCRFGVDWLGPMMRQGGQSFFLNVEVRWVVVIDFIYFFVRVCLVFDRLHL